MKILAEMRAADSFPWSDKQLRYHRQVFPQMTNWLPPEEAAQMRFEFQAELARLEAA